MNAQRCIGCRKPIDDWTENEGRGYIRANARYCCQGCANGVGCSCQMTPHSVEGH